MQVDQKEDGAKNVDKSWESITILGKQSDHILYEEEVAQNFINYKESALSR